MESNDLCAFCGMLGGEVSWSESPSDSGDGVSYIGSHIKRLERSKRITKINQILSSSGYKVSDWQNTRFVVKNSTGRSKLVNTLPQIWLSIEAQSPGKIDPLDEVFLNKIEKL